MVGYRFLLVSLTIETILGETTIHRRKEKLRQMSSGQGVGDVYAATLERIRTQNKDRARLGMEAIMWVAHSERPLQPDALCQALGVEIGSRDLNNDNVPSIRMILNCGLGLVTVDSSSCRVRLVHFTLQEYILANPTLFQSPHSMIAEVCLTYLNFACIRSLSPTLSSLPLTAPFLIYASCYWGAHARREISKRAIPLALKLLDRFDAHISCKVLLFNGLWGHEYFKAGGGRPIGFTGLHGGAFLGVLEIIVSSFDIGKWDLNATDLCGRTALEWAAEKGHSRDVKILLEQEGVIPDIADNKGETPLSVASGKGCSEIVRMLLGRSNVGLNAADEHGRTPLTWAAFTGNAVVVKMLLGRNDIDPDLADTMGRTPLSWASVGFGHRKNKNSHTEGRTGLMEENLASRSGCEMVAEMLLKRSDVDPNTADEDGRTPLSLAASSGFEEFVEMLLVRNDINPDEPDERGRTPLSWASSYGKVEIVEMLLERNDVNPDRPDARGRTPFSWAAKYGDRKVVDMLLERNNVYPNAADENGRTPISWAASSGREEIVEMLLERNDVDPNAADKSGRTPLSWAVVGWADEPDDSLGKEGKTSLGCPGGSFASRSGCTMVAEMLLKRSDVDPNTADEDGRTPLSLAAGGGHWEIAKILLQRSDVNPDTADKSGRTPLSWAVVNEQEEIVHMLLERNDVDPNTADEDGHTPLSLAAMSGHEAILDMLSELNDVNPDLADASSRTPFPWAPENGYTQVTQLLEGPQDLITKLPSAGELSEPLVAESPGIPEPPPKRIRRL